ncbi:hypothetical protein COY13_02000 [Candidatus Roizmanbacteria bacterium CG_4_10_14_0_2_um_filter_36_35]|uniref:Uncharacterized protein n=3 Tax=Candidatus Roizmaniibacteriota TaxID=1752723 RepID=A0A2M7BVY8_9BACT|nr:hypothetical protein [Candidatus Roizmanbacteria bacterium]PIQ72446.1 MAG: hypothetical protein COV86_02970 [Candidatus Roizmanbacteria bacterium CG11_big_fil_rev_8_21_14_0_20_35_14]PIV10685.1 MAG: hypothetical protein COS50_04185 [Candidatus Roizmanbacteria bacterium CG03_land_8_20_14_0_80_35_26]PIZ68015.1 MAG: hypothetical protein COY13_02000 [Candidatus Roizmanbacteria bacterium CG_4_10_14_0_2_um_filter_36_35]
MGLKDDIQAAIETVPTALTQPDSIYPMGVKSVGNDKTPSFLKKIGCISIFAVPIVGGVIGVLQTIKVLGYEHIAPTCAASVGLIAVGVIALIKNALRKK